MTKLGIAFSTLPNGTQYDVFRTIQYNDYKPSSNSTSITVRPQTTEGSTTLKTIEQMQEGVGLWFSLTNEWGKSILDYPWYRTHVRVHMNVSGLDLRFHIGMSPILPDVPILDWSDDLGQLFDSLLKEAIEETLVSVGVLMGMYLGAKALSIIGKTTLQPYLVAVAMILESAKLGYQISLFLGDLNNKAKMLASCIVNLLLTLLTVCRIDVVLLFIESLGVGLSMTALSALRWAGQQIRLMFGVVDSAFKFIRDYIDLIDVIFDVILFILSGIRFSQL